MKTTKYSHLLEMREVLKEKVASGGTIKLISEGDSEYNVTINHLETLIKEYEKHEREAQAVKDHYNTLRAKLESTIADFYLAI